MALRLIEIVLHKKDLDDLRDFLKEHPVIEHTELQLLNNSILNHILLAAEESEVVLDFLDQNYADSDNHRITILPVEATLPRVEELSPVEPGQQIQERVAREELYEDIKDSARCSKIYITMLILSTLVASVGLHNNNIVILIGAMVIAPLLEPIIALSLGITLLDLPLLRRAFLTTSAGIGLTCILSIIIGAVIQNIDPTLPEIAARTQMQKGDLAVALASGCAGALAFTTGVSTTLIGVMVAVSLLPPLATFGLLLGAGYPLLAEGSLMLFLMNLISVNVASVSVFLIQGIHPKNWLESSKIEKSIRIVILGVWLFILLTFLLFFRIYLFH
jgi:uncharacterized hydrophobic protein (TIGR00341 family)